MSEPIISVSGLRGIVGESLTPEVAIRYACAFAAELPPGPLVITRDGRATGPMLAAAVRGGLTAVGPRRDRCRRRRHAHHRRAGAAASRPPAAFRFPPATIRPSTTA